MAIFPIDAGVLRRLSGLSIADELRRELRAAEASILRNQRTLTWERSSLYGQTFWMVTAAEALMRAEIVADNRRRRLTELGERHGTPTTAKEVAPWAA